jgi:hypothetical protein
MKKEQSTKTARKVNVMSNDHTYPRMMCPFYHTREGNTITCEGVVGRSQRAVFPNKPSKALHEATYCTTWDYKKCPQYRAVQQKYIDKQK